MHKDDQMTPKQRLANLNAGKEIDRMPIIPVFSNVVPRLSGMNLRDIRASAQNEAQSQLHAYQLLGYDSVVSDYGLHGIGIAMGSQVNNPESAVAAIEHHVLTDFKNLDQLDPENASRKKDPKFARHYEAAEIMLEQVGDECAVLAQISGPFTAAASIYPTEQILRASIKNPENLHKLIRFSTDCIKTVISEYMALNNVGFAMGDPVASGTVLKSKDYDEFVKPYMTEIAEHVHKLGSSIGYHICGNTLSILESMADTGVDFLSLDNQVDMQTAKERVGSRVALIGNVDPTGVMMLGTVDEVDQAVKVCFQKTADSPKGYMLSTGCDVPFNAPLENLTAFMDAGRKYGKWPLNPNLYQ